MGCGNILASDLELQDDARPVRRESARVAIYRGPVHEPSHRRQCYQRESLSSLVPWEPKLLEFLTLNAKTTHLLVVLQKKLHDADFCVPIQGVYEPMLPECATERYQLVVDGEYYSVRRAQQVTKEVSYANLNEMPALDIAKYLGSRVVRRLKRSFGH